MSDVSNCPNCGSTDLEEIASNKQRCVYCGTVLRVRKPPPGAVRCPHCGFENEQGDRYCNNCGKALVSWMPVAKKMDPALLSILVSVAGSLILPLGAAIGGLILGYKALQGARASGEGDAERRAKGAVAVGWFVLAASLFPLCLAVIAPGVELGCSACNRLFRGLESLLFDALR